MRILAADGVEVELDEDHWKTHIVKRHPELLSYLGLVVETLKSPDGIFRGKRDRTVRIYVKSYSRLPIRESTVEKISLRVFVREEGAFVATAYFAGAEWRGIGEKIWPL